jgi:hypothetical protein
MDTNVEWQLKRFQSRKRVTKTIVAMVTLLEIKSLLFFLPTQLILRVVVYRVLCLPTKISNRYI